MDSGDLEARYELDQELGRGSFGVVYRARRRKDGRVFAAKLGFARDLEQRRRVLREASLLEETRHPRLACLEDVSIAQDGRLALIFEYVEGEPLSRLLERGHQLPRAAGWIRDVAEALDAMHERGILHRDVKPGNVMVEPDGRARLLDFGLVRTEEEGGTLTGTGILFGTPGYMPPEWILGERPGRAGDVYSLACMAFQLVEGELPFDGDGPVKILEAQQAGPPPTRRAPPALRSQLDEFFAGALAADPLRRPSSAGLMAEQFDRALRDPADPKAAATLAIGRRSETAPRARVTAESRSVSAGGRRETGRHRRGRLFRTLAPIVGVLLLGLFIGTLLEEPSGQELPPPPSSPADPEGLARAAMTTRCEALWRLLTGTAWPGRFHLLDPWVREDIPTVMSGREFRQRWRELRRAWFAWGRLVDSREGFLGRSGTDEDVRLLWEVGSFLHETCQVIRRQQTRLMNPFRANSVVQAISRQGEAKELSDAAESLSRELRESLIEALGEPGPRGPALEITLLRLLAELDRTLVVERLAAARDRLLERGISPSVSRLGSLVTWMGLYLRTDLDCETMEATFRAGIDQDWSTPTPGELPDLWRASRLVELGLYSWEACNRPVSRASTLGLLELSTRLRERLDAPAGIDDVSEIGTCRESLAQARRAAESSKTSGTPSGRRILNELDAVEKTLANLESDPPALPQDVDDEVWGDYARRVRRELRQALHWRVTPDGRFMDRNRYDTRSFPLLPRDPSVWWRARPRLIQVRRFHAWMSAGGEPERLPPELRDALLEVDREYGDLGRTRPFYPFLELRPSPDHIDLPDEVAELARAGRGESPVKLEIPLPLRAEGWLGEAFRHLGRALRFHDRLAAAFRAGLRGEVVEDAPAEFALPASVLAIGPTVDAQQGLSELEDVLEAYASFAFDSRATQEDFDAFLTPGRDSLHKGLACLRRAVEAEPAHAQALALLGWRAAERCRLLWFSSLASRSREEILGRRQDGRGPTILLEAAVAAGIRRGGGELRDSMGLGRETRIFLQAAVLAPASGPLVPSSRRVLFSALVKECKSTADVLVAYRGSRERLRTMPLHQRGAALQAAVTELVRKPPRVAAGHFEVVQGLRKDVAGVVADARDLHWKSAARQVQVDLERWVKRLRRRD